MNRRGFLGAILAAAVSPAIVRADSLMRIVPRETAVWVAGPTMTLDALAQFRGEVGTWEGVRIHRQVPFSVERVREIADLMRSYHIKPIRDGSYLMLLPGGQAHLIR